ncbi:MAG: magnesium transporter [Thermoanaerobaculia bacterium]
MSESRKRTFFARPDAELPSAKELPIRLTRMAPRAAARLLARYPDDTAAVALALVNPALTVEILAALDPERRKRIAEADVSGRGPQWLEDTLYPPNTVGRQMDRPLAVFSPETTVTEAIERLRELMKRARLHLAFVTESDGRLLGVFAFRELLFAAPDAPVSSLMNRDLETLQPGLSMLEATKAIIANHYPAYPVVDGEGRLVGMIRARTIFEQEAFEISAQAGKMVGVEAEERVSTSWWRSFRFRHPWLQLNLLTAFVAAGVVSIFQGTLDRIVVLAVFLPVLAGQSGNTGCQALAVTLRGLALGEIDRLQARSMLKEAWVGILNGIFVGIVAGVGMFIFARSQASESPAMLGFCVFAAMIISCAASGLSGATIPLILKKLGADPATASSIFLTTATDVVSMGAFLGLATLLIR